MDMIEFDLTDEERKEISKFEVVNLKSIEFEQKQCPLCELLNSRDILLNMIK